MRFSTIVLITGLGLSSTLNAQERTDRNVIFGMYSGLALLMDVHYPETPNGYGIVFIRGTGYHRDLNYDELPISPDMVDRDRYGAQDLLVAGYTLFSINHRAAPRFQYPAAVEDARRAVRFVRHNADSFGIDPDRIGAYGESSGGYLVSLLGLQDGAPDKDTSSPVDRESARVQVVAALYPPTDLVAHVRSSPSASEVTASFLGATIDQAEDLYIEASPVTYVSVDDSPFLLVHGDADQVVPFSQSERFRDALKDVGVDAELIRVQGGGHAAAISSGPTPTDFITPMIHWFDTHLRR